MCLCVLHLLWEIKNLAEPVQCVSGAPEKKEDEKVKCVEEMSCHFHWPSGSAASCLL